MRAYPNPQITYVREQTFGAFGTGEDYLTVAQTIDLGNRRGLHGEAGEARARAAEQDGEAWQLAIAAEAFDEAGYYDRATCKRLHDTIISVGNSVAPEQAYRNFRGRDIDAQALMRYLGFDVVAN